MALFDPKKNQIAQLQKSIDEKNRQIAANYDGIGKLYYQQYRDMNADVSRDINALCEGISTLYIEIEECRLRIMYERGLKECKTCRKENPLEHQYCSACGSKFPETNDISVLTHVESIDVAAPIAPAVPVADPAPQTEGGDEVEMTEADANVIPQENEQPAASEELEEANTLPEENE